MSDETPYFVEQTWCPECQSPPSDTAHVHYCTQHMPVTDGTSDRLVEGNGEYIFHGEAGESASHLLNFLHRSTHA